MSNRAIDRTEDQAATRQAAKAAQEVAKQRRLDGAPQIAALLRGNPRIDINDRPIFAANLARMCGDASSDGKSSVRRIFETAFGKASGDAKYKKLKRFVRAKDDEQPSEGFAAHGADFVDLAEATAKISQAGHSDAVIQQAKLQAILQLVEGSSLDDKRPPEARMKDKAVLMLVEHVESMVRKVDAEVDLDAMRAVVDHDEISAIIDGNGRIERLIPTEAHGIGLERSKDESDESHDARWIKREMSRKHLAERELWGLLGDKWNHLYDKPNGRITEDDLRLVAAAKHIALKEPNDEPVPIFPEDLDDPSDSEFAYRIRSPFAPRVSLGDIYSPVDIEGAVTLDIDEAEIKETLNQQERDYNAAIASSRLAELAPPFNRSRAERRLLKDAAVKALALRFGYSEAWIAKECSSFETLDEKIAEDGFEPPENPWIEEEFSGVLVRRQIELILLRDLTTARWHPWLALAQGECAEASYREGVYGINNDELGFLPSIYLGLYDEGGLSPMGDSEFYAHVSLFLHKVGDNSFVLYAVEPSVEHFEEKVLGLDLWGIPIPHPESLDTLFIPIESSSVRPHFFEVPFKYRNKPAPARPNTLAGMILRNLAYAPDDERYDLRLLEDARRKADMARKLSEERMAEFEAAIRRVR